jgi:hypothetical protein
MHARVATFDLGEGADEMIDDIRRDVEGGGPPPGLEDAEGMMMLVDRNNRKGMGIVFFDSEDAMKRGDEVLNNMSPSGASRRTSVEFYEVPVQRMG